MIPLYSADSAAADAKHTSNPRQQEPTVLTTTQQQQQQQQQQRGHPEDDDVMASIRNVRRMLEQEFGEAECRRRQKTTITSNGLQQQKEKPRDEEETDDVVNHDDDNDDDDDEDDNVGGGDDYEFGDSWKNQCFRLKQELFEEKNRSRELVQKHKDELARASSKLEGALSEAFHDRDLKEALVNTLEAQTKHSDGISKQLDESRKNSTTLQVKWKDLVRTMEEEKESMDKERETSLMLLEETRRRLTLSMVEQERIEKEACVKSEALAKRVEELEIMNAASREIVVTEEAKELQHLPSCWNKSKTRTSLQQKLRQLEESFTKDAETIRSLEHRIAATTKSKVTETNKTPMELSASESASASTSSSISATQKSQLNDKKIQLRTKSLGVMGDVIILQLQRLMEIHKETTTETPTKKTTGIKNEAVGSNDINDDDEEWKSILQKLTHNRSRVFELNKHDSCCGNVKGVSKVREVAAAASAAATVAEKKKRDGCDQDDGGSPPKRPKTQK